MGDDDFTPRMVGSRTGERTRKSYLSHLGRKAGKFRAAGHVAKDRPSLHLRGRGAAAGSLLSVRQQQARSMTRRVTVKVARFRLRGNALARTSAHLRYIVRDGVSKDGSTPPLYNGYNDLADPHTFARLTKDDLGHFALIVSPEDGDQLPDLKPFVRRLMAQVEEDLGTSLDWLAVDHFDTGTPHTHILLRGSVENGGPLLIARDYISHGFRERAVDAMLVELGPDLSADQARHLRQEAQLPRVTDLDVRIMADSLSGGMVTTMHDAPFEQAQRTRRLRVLEQLGLAHPVGALTWQIDPDLPSRLQEVDRQAERLASLRRAAARVGLEQGRGGHRLYDTDHPPRHALVGALIADPSALSLANRITLMIDGADGQLHSVETVSDRQVMQLRAGMIIEVSAANVPAGDKYAVASAQPDIVTTRLKIELLSTLPLQLSVDFDGPTWLDQTLVSNDILLARDAGFGRELRTAQLQRQRWLIEQGLLVPGTMDQERTDPGLPQQANDKPTARSRLLATLRQREFLRIAGQLSEELGLEFVAHEKGDLVPGTMRQLVNLSQGRFAVFEDGYQFRLVPWDTTRKMMSGIGLPAHIGDGIDWPGGRSRGGPSIS